VAATNSNIDSVAVALHVHAFRAELVDALLLSHKHNLELLAVRVVVDVLGEALVNLVVFDGDVDRDS